MKTIKIAIALVLAMVLGHMASAQRWKSDPTYSTGNYKQPNKAAYMKKQQDAQPVVYVEEVKDENAVKAEENNMTTSANYKGMSASKTKTKKFKASDSPSAKPFFHVSPAQQNANYKQQFPTRERKSSAKEGQTSEVPVAVQ